MATRVDMTTLADELVDILENIQRTGEQYDIDRDGEVIAFDHLSEGSQGCPAQ